MNQWLNLFKYQIRNELRSRYLGSVLGLLWSFLNPLLQMGMYVFLFMIVFKVRLKETGSSLDYVLFILSTMTGWLAFQEALLSAATSIAKNGSIIKNVYFPKEIFPLSAVISCIITWSVGIALYFIIFFIAGKEITLRWMALPIIFLSQLILSVALGFLISIIGAFYKDIMIMLPIVLQFLLIGTPIFYGIEDLPEKLKIFSNFNPLTYLFKAYRDVLFYGLWPNFLHLFLFTFCAIILMIFTFKLFKKVDGYFEAIV